MSSTHQALTNCRTAFFATVLLVLSACSDSGSSGPVAASSALPVSGSVGDGPVANADLTFEDATGAVIGTTTSDANAKYSFEIPAGTLMPVTVRATAGTDMVTGRELDFDLVAVANMDGSGTVNLTPQSTLTVATARCLNNDLSAAGLRETWLLGREQIGMGMDAELLPDPMTQVIDVDNAANVVLATEALGETIRRTVAALNDGSVDGVDGNSVITELGCDMAYGGQIDGYWSQGVMRTGAVYRAAETAVLVEMIAGDLQVDGASANALMDQAVNNIIEPGLVAPSVTEVPLQNSMIDHTLDSVLLMQSLNSSDAALLELADLLIESQSTELRTRMRSEMPDGLASSFSELSARLANPSTDAASDLARSAVEQNANRAPYISLIAEDKTLVQGASTKVSWASASADRCLASGTEDWAGPVSLSGRFFAENLQHSTQFELRCYGVGGTNRAAIKVLVSDNVGSPIEDPLDVAQRPDPGSVEAPQRGVEPIAEVGGDVPSEQNEEIVASPGTGAGGNTGTIDKPAGGSQDVVDGGNAGGGNSGDGSQDVAEDQTPPPADTGTVNRVVVAWQAPDQNTDGSTIQGLSGYRLFYGATSGSYTEEAFVDDAQATEVGLDLSPGVYYLAMVAVAADSTQSALSNEVQIESR